MNKLEIQLNKIHCGDNREIMKMFPPDSIDLVVTSPPYWGLRDYGVGDDQLGLEPHPQEYVNNLVDVFREVKRVLKPSGSFWLNLGDTYCSSGKWVNKELGDIGKQNRSVEGGSVDAYSMRGKLKPDGGWIQPKQKLMIPHRVAIALQDDGWILRNDVIWHKPNHMPESVQDRLTKSYENMFFFVKARKYYFDLDAIRRPYAESSIARINQPSIMSQMGGEKQHELYGDAPGHGNRPADILKGLASKYANRADSNTLGSPRARAGIREVSEGNPKGKNPGDVWEINTKPFPGAHFAVFPPKLIEPIIKAACPVDGVVLDPFAGSGTALRVSRRLGRKFIGIELNPEYAALCEVRVRGDSYRAAPESVPKLSSFSKRVNIE